LIFSSNLNTPSSEMLISGIDGMELLAGCGIIVLVSSLVHANSYCLLSMAALSFGSLVSLRSDFMYDQKRFWFPGFSSFSGSPNSIMLSLYYLRRRNHYQSLVTSQNIKTLTQQLTEYRKSILGICGQHNWIWRPREGWEPWKSKTPFLLKCLYRVRVITVFIVFGCWLILSVYIIMSFDFPFVRLLGVRYFDSYIIYSPMFMIKLYFCLACEWMNGTQCNCSRTCLPIRQMTS
jgi:hypothetical protein